MCTMIVKQTNIQGSGKGRNDWFTLTKLSVSYDHPYHVADEYALNIDFMDTTGDPGARVAVELDAESARILAKTILEILERAESGGFILKKP